MSVSLGQASQEMWRHTPDSVRYISWWNPASKRASHPYQCTKWTMGEGWDQHLPTQETWLLTGGRLSQYLSTGAVTNRTNSNPCDRYPEDDVPRTWHSSTSMYQPGQAACLKRILWVHKELQIWNTASRYPELNGFIRSMVKVVKQIVIRSEQANEDAYIAVLAYRSRLRGPDKLSLAEAMTQDRLRALLPIREHLPARLEESREVMLQQKQKQAEYYSQAAWLLPELQQDQQVHG